MINTKPLTFVRTTVIRDALSMSNVDLTRQIDEAYKRLAPIEGGVFFLNYSLIPISNSTHAQLTLIFGE